MFLLNNSVVFRKNKRLGLRLTNVQYSIENICVAQRENMLNTIYSLFFAIIKQKKKCLIVNHNMILSMHKHCVSSVK